MIVNSVSHPFNVIDVSVGVSEGVSIGEVWSVGARTDVVIDSLTDVVTNIVTISLEFVVTSL